MGVIVYADPQGGATDWQTTDENIGYDEATGHWLVRAKGGDAVRRIPRERVFYVETDE